MAAAALSLVCSCSEVRGRRLLQKANQLYRDGQYPQAVEAFKEAERFVPDMWLLWLNKGYTCRSMLVPGARTPENEAVLKCALEAFKRLQELKPEDHRGAALYAQTLFDADQFEVLARMYEQRFQKDPRDVEALQGLIQVYSKWPNHLDDALQWHRKKVELLPNDAEAHYSAGVFIWHQLFTRGGGADRASFDPRPDPNRPRQAKGQAKVPPPMASQDIVGQQRVDMADEGIKLLEKAVALRPRYQEAMAYLNLLYRQKSYAYFDQPDEWQKCVDKATEWRNKTLLTMGKPIPKQPSDQKTATEAGTETSDSASTAPADRGDGVKTRKQKTSGKIKGKT